jgi:hypothetical protein
MPPYKNLHQNHVILLLARHIPGCQMSHADMPHLSAMKASACQPTPLAPLPIPEQPNWRIHADLFRPMLTADSNKKFVLCITEAFTKYATVTVIPNKIAETVAEVIFKERFCKFRIPAQEHTDGGKEFVNKLSAEMMELLNILHTKTSPAHPQCNSQVEVFNICQ